MTYVAFVSAIAFVVIAIIGVQQAAGIAGVSPDTIARWCKRYGIGKQLHRKAPWRVDPEGLGIVAAGDGSALEKYRETTAHAGKLRMVSTQS